MIRDSAKYEVAEQVVRERVSQDLIWGEQNHPDGTGPNVADDNDCFAGGLYTTWARLAADARRSCKAAAAEGRATWLHILREEVYEAFAESDPVKLRAELIQVAAVCIAWAEAIDRRSAS